MLQPEKVEWGYHPQCHLPPRNKASFFGGMNHHDPLITPEGGVGISGVGPLRFLNKHFVKQQKNKERLKHDNMNIHYNVYIDDMNLKCHQYLHVTWYLLLLWPMSLQWLFGREHGTRMNNGLRKHVRKLVILGITSPCQKGRAFNHGNLHDSNRWWNHPWPSNSSSWMHVRIVTCSYICQDGCLDEIQEKPMGWKLQQRDIHGDMFGISTFCRISSMNSIVDEDMGYTVYKYRVTGYNPPQIWEWILVFSCQIIHLQNVTYPVSPQYTTMHVFVIMFINNSMIKYT